ncbi:MAG: hypothetical protein ACI9MC_001914 [Kiritimatiellia bacterium]|jgi:hypothetical protein
MKHLLPLFALTTASMILPTMSQAVDIEDLDGSSAKKKKKKDKAEVVIESDEIIREIERGLFVKANAGMASYFLTYGGGTAQDGNPYPAILRSGSLVALTVGNDFVDEPNRSMAWEVSFAQGLHNGMLFDEQALRRIPQDKHIQGDTRTFALLASYEYSVYPNRRIGIGFKVNAGIMLTPLLMNEQFYLTEVVNGRWGLPGQPAVHTSPHFPVGGGPTFEYYTKLSHFSVGIDADFTYVVGFDGGVNATGFMKYTF